MTVKLPATFIPHSMGNEDSWARLRVTDVSRHGVDAVVIAASTRRLVGQVLYDIKQRKFLHWNASLDDLEKIQIGTIFTLKLCKANKYGLKVELVSWRHVEF